MGWFTEREPAGTKERLSFVSSNDPDTEEPNLLNKPNIQIL
jgi:hypothetical protein